MSALLTTTMPNMQECIDKLTERGLRDKYIVMVGGAPLSGDYAEGIDANYSEDAVTCVELADKLMAS